MLPLDDTIAAIASAPGGAARGILRLSGPNVRECVERCFQAHQAVDMASITAPTAVAGTMRMAGFASPLPSTLYYWPGRRSYTGQPVAEIHTLGSPPLLEVVLRTLCAAGARPAERGEFTLRAFLAGRIDLTQAEAVLGVIDAADPRELNVALGQLAGGLAAPLHQLRDALLDLLAHLEAGLDFAEEDLPFITREQLDEQLGDAAERVAETVRQMKSRGESTELARVVLVGRPNTGKSSLFNALVGDAGALVSGQPGTTRDYLTAELCLDGLRCQLVDTAGLTDRKGTVPFSLRENRDSPQPTLRPSLTELEQAAAAVSSEQGRRAHLRILCLDATRPLDAWERDQAAWAAEATCVPVWTKVDAAPLASISRRRVGQGREDAGGTSQTDPSQIGALSVAIVKTATEVPPASRFACPTLHVGEKCGLGTVPLGSPDLQPVATSSVTGEGLHALRNAIRDALLSASATHADVVPGTAIRCRQSLSTAAAALSRARELARGGQGEELIAVEVRLALDELGQVVGAVYSDDVLDRIFSRFCIGK